MSQNFEHIAPILSEGNSNNDLGDDTIIKDMVGYFNNKRKILILLLMIILVK